MKRKKVNFVTLVGKKARKLLLAVLAILGGVIGTTVIQPEQACVAAAAPTQIGIVDYTYLIDHHPDTPKANEALKAERDQAQKEYNEKAAILNEMGKQELQNQLNQQVEKKRMELLKPITDQINDAIKAVAETKKLTVVAYKNTFAYGGVDITQEVAAKLGEK
jgi:outer membrane protein